MDDRTNRSVAQLLTGCRNTAAGQASLAQAERLLSHLLDKPLAWLLAHGEHQPDQATNTAFDHAWQRVCTGEPLAYVLGEVDFYGRRMLVNPAVLIPRPETELLVEACLSLDLPVAARVLDLGCGSGAIAVSLACARSQWQVCAVDVSPAALDVCSNNAKLHGVTQRVQIVESDWWQAVAGQDWDLVVSNPPYIARGDSALAEAVIQHEPALALFAEDDGLAAYAQILHGFAATPAKAILLCEHGYRQQQALADLVVSVGLVCEKRINDYAGHPRIMQIRH